MTYVRYWMLPRPPHSSPIGRMVRRTSLPFGYRYTDSAFEVVVAADDPKIRRIAVDDRSVLTVFEAVPPFRGVKVARARYAGSRSDGGREAREAIASRYLGVSRVARPSWRAVVPAS